MAGLLRDPRVRLLLLVVLALASFALVWHLVGMPDHPGGRFDGEVVMLAACFAVVAAALPVIRPGNFGLSAPPLVPVRAIVAEPGLPPAPGRDPPDEGSVLRL